jgi:hypothetical protein
MIPELILFHPSCHPPPHTIFESCLLLPRLNSPFTLSLEELRDLTPCLSTWEILRQCRLRRGSCHSCHAHNLDTQAHAKQFWQKKTTTGCKIHKRQTINWQWPWVFTSFLALVLTSLWHILSPSCVNLLPCCFWLSSKVYTRWSSELMRM